MRSFIKNKKVVQSDVGDGIKALIIKGKRTIGMLSGYYTGYIVPFVLWRGDKCVNKFT